MRGREQLQHDRRAAGERDQVLGILGAVREGGDRHCDLGARQHLVREQLVAAAPDGACAVEAIGAGVGELAQDRHAVIGDRGADPGDHRVIAGQRVAVIVNLGVDRADPHVAARRVDHFDDMAARLGGVDQADRGIVARLAREQRDPERAARGPALRQAIVEFVAELRLAEGSVGVDDHVRLDRRPAEQHPVGHRLAVRQGQLDRPAQVAHLGVRLDDVAKFAVTIRADHFAPVHDRGRARDFEPRIVRVRLDQEADLRGTRRAERLDHAGMQRGRLGAGIDLRLDRRQAEIAQRKPFFPAELEVRCVRHGKGLILRPAPG